MQYKATSILIKYVFIRKFIGYKKRPRLRSLNKGKTILIEFNILFYTTSFC